MHASCYNIVMYVPVGGNIIIIVIIIINIITLIFISAVGFDKLID